MTARMQAILDRGGRRDDGHAEAVLFEAGLRQALRRWRRRHPQATTRRRAKAWAR